MINKIKLLDPLVARRCSDRWVDLFDFDSRHHMLLTLRSESKNRFGRLWLRHKITRSRMDILFEEQRVYFDNDFDGLTPYDVIAIGMLDCVGDPLRKSVELIITESPRGERALAQIRPSHGLSRVLGGWIRMGMLGFRLENQADFNRWKEFAEAEHRSDMYGDEVVSISDLIDAIQTRCAQIRTERGLSLENSPSRPPSEG